MTYFQLVNELKKCFLEEPNIAWVGSKDIYELNTLPDLKYSLGYITPNQHILNEDTIRYSLNLYYIDRWDETDNNQLQIHSSGLIALNNIINRFNNKFPDVVINYPLNCQLFYQKFKDVCSGVYVTVSFELDNVVGLCD